ncbi:MAG: 2Fe-2S iron-sulfur cluster-binding protein [Campylobacterota bacterium]|nr:2Fe-2S iron-sulfur cluster-binding protein [Campylobacterota bacterium]
MSINFTIDGQSVTAERGESILEVARREGIYIPTMCYLAKTTPNASCRMCVVEVEGVDGFILSCNTPPTEGAAISTNSGELFSERQNIMKLYNVNHPLQCGVCDKSGECDLQNKTLEYEVSEQTFATKEHKRKEKKWGVLSYDPYLCIMCEKCTAVCNQVVGSEALYIKPGGYKSEIDNHYSQCIQCGECISVCPVGAMASTDFEYTANAWELSKIPSACAHCSSACALEYEVKEIGIDSRSGDKEIYRVTNEADHDSLCGAGRFAYDYENRVTCKDEKAFNRALKAFESAKSIHFTSMISNEEAYLLQSLKEKHGYKLINAEAKAYQAFMKAYTSVSGQKLYSASLESIRKSDYAISIGCAISNDNPMIRFALSQAVNNNRAYVSAMHPIEDESIRNIVSQYVKYEVGSEEGLMALLCQEFLSEDHRDDFSEFLKTLDNGYICGESSVGEEEFEKLVRYKKRKKASVLILGADLFSHPEAENIAKMAGLLERYSDFDVMIAPSNTNTLGVSLICDLDDESLAPSIGYNAQADFVMSALGNGDIDMPAMNQQEGTLTSINQEVVALNAGVPYHGYELSDIANALGVTCKHVIDFTCKLPTNKGFEAIAFDDLENYYHNDGRQVRGYKLKSRRIKASGSPHAIAEIKEFNGSVIYAVNPISQFNPFTDKAHQIVDKAVLIGSQQFADAAKIKGGSEVNFTLNGVSITRKFQISHKLKGTVALNPTFDTMQSSAQYRYNQVKLERV